MDTLVVMEFPTTTPVHLGATDPHLVRVDDWSSSIGSQVYVVRHGPVIRFGVIELTRADEAVARVAPSGAEPQQLISRAEDHELRTAPTQVQPTEVGGWQ